MTRHLTRAKGSSRGSRGDRPEQGSGLPTRQERLPEALPGLHGPRALGAGAGHWGGDPHLQPQGARLACPLARGAQSDHCPLLLPGNRDSDQAEPEADKVLRGSQGLEGPQGTGPGAQGSRWWGNSSSRGAQPFLSLARWPAAVGPAASRRWAAPWAVGPGYRYAHREERVAGEGGPRRAAAVPGRRWASSCPLVCREPPQWTHLLTSCPAGAHLAVLGARPLFYRGGKYREVVRR